LDHLYGADPPLSTRRDTKCPERECCLRFRGNLSKNFYEDSSDNFRFFWIFNTLQTRQNNQMHPDNEHLILRYVTGCYLCSLFKRSKPLLINTGTRASPTALQQKGHDSAHQHRRQRAKVLPGRFLPYRFPGLFNKDAGVNRLCFADDPNKFAKFLCHVRYGSPQDEIEFHKEFRAVTECRNR
jgi:hypothetical protein